MSTEIGPFRSAAVVRLSEAGPARRRGPQRKPRDPDPREEAAAEESQPDRILRTLKLEPGMAIADLGAGRGGGNVLHRHARSIGVVSGDLMPGKKTPPAVAWGGRAVQLFFAALRAAYFPMPMPSAGEVCLPVLADYNPTACSESGQVQLQRSVLPMASSIAAVLVRTSSVSCPDCARPICVRLETRLT